MQDTLWSRRISIFLLAAEQANQTIKSNYPETYEVCQKAIEQCWEWFGNRITQPKTLAYYLDANDTDNIWLQESLFERDPDGLNVLIFITMIIGHVAHLAYFQAGETKFMSEIIAEAGENIIESIIDYGSKLKLWNP